MKKYEYKVIFKGAPAALNDKKSTEIAQELEKELNQLGAEGWEFVQWKNNLIILKQETGSL